MNQPTSSSRSTTTAPPFLKSNKCTYLNHFIVPQKPNAHLHQGQDSALQSAKKLSNGTKDKSASNPPRNMAPLFLCVSPYRQDRSTRRMPDFTHTFNSKLKKVGCEFSISIFFGNTDNPRETIASQRLLAYNRRGKLPLRLDPTPPVTP